ncbi:hypothetical protein QQZ08_008878 [Neonectria magnoliae]|uniref:DUF6594 domain-containing protein n=1 Tax=Neonectria magnoliae TaxID=2732573 RepID=A0ABR1HRP3_9HYPO
MNFDDDIEKKGGLTPITEAVTEVEDDNTSACGRSHAPSFSDVRLSTESRRADSHALSSIRSRAPTDASEHLQSVSGHQNQGRGSIDSVKSRRSSGEAPPSPSLEEPGDITPPAGHGQDAESTGKDLDRSRPGEWVIYHHRSSLITEIQNPEDGYLQAALKALGINGERPVSTSSNGDGRRFRISFAEVQRMRIRKLQCQLVRHVAKMRLDGHESPGWERTLEQYIKALQDHDYMEKRSESMRDPFLATGEYAVDNYVLNCNIDKVLANDEGIKENVESSLRPWEYIDPLNPKQAYEPICGTRGNNIATTWVRGFKERLLLAAVGGAFLVGPMWLMALQSELYSSLISTTAFVSSFGVLMAYFLREGKDVLASTAAYAAVLVVFVGSSNQ